MTLRKRVSIELGSLALLTTGFLLLFPERHVVVDIALALFALGLIAVNAGWTRNVLWARFPPDSGKPDLRRSFSITMSVTGAIALALLAVGSGIAYSGGGGGAVAERILDWRILASICLYFPWALLQQTLFQFYLLGRLRVLMALTSRWPAVTLTGIGYAMVHLPDLWITLVTSVAGVFWTYMYYRFRALSPLALSHAVLGSAFYHWVYGRDLLADWLRFFG